MSVLILSSLYWHHVARSGDKNQDSAQNAGVHNQGPAISPQFGESAGKENLGYLWAADSTVYRRLFEAYPKLNQINFLMLTECWSRNLPFFYPLDLITYLKALVFIPKAVSWTLPAHLKKKQSVGVIRQCYAHLRFPLRDF